MTDALLKTIIFPSAGLGTRFLPATKACRKELLPVVDKPLIQYAVEEATEAGFTQIIFVVRKGEESILEYFSDAPDLQEALSKTKTEKEIRALTATVPATIKCAYIEQPEALGLGHAIWCARSLISESYFAVLLPDDLIDGGFHKGCMSQMTKLYEQHQCGLIGVEEINACDTGKYGIVDTVDINAKVSQITQIVEKPSPEDAPSRLGVVGRYILPTDIMSVLEANQLGAGGEIQITDAISSILSKHKIDAYRFDGARYDCGSKLGYSQANVAYAMKSPEVGNEFRSWLRKEILEEI